VSPHPLKHAAPEPSPAFAARHRELIERLTLLAQDYDNLRLEELAVGEPWITEAISVILRGICHAVAEGHRGDIVEWANGPREFLDASPEEGSVTAWLTDQAEGLCNLVDTIERELRTTTPAVTEVEYDARKAKEMARAHDEKMEGPLPLGVLRGLDPGAATNAAVEIVLTDLFFNRENHQKLRQGLNPPAPTELPELAQPAQRELRAKAFESVHDVLFPRRPRSSTHPDEEPRDAAGHIVKKILLVYGHCNVKGVMSAVDKQTARDREARAATRVAAAKGAAAAKTPKAQ